MTVPDHLRKITSNEKLKDEIIYVLGGGDDLLSPEEHKSDGYMSNDGIEYELNKSREENIIGTPFYLKVMESDGLLESKKSPIDANHPHDGWEFIYKLSKNGVQRLNEIVKAKLFSYPNELPRSDELINEAIHILGGGDEPLSLEDLTKNGYQTSRVLEMQVKEILGDNLPIPFYFENMEWNGLLKSDLFQEHGNAPYPLERAYKLSEKGIKRLKEILKAKEEKNTQFQMRAS